MIPFEIASVFLLTSLVVIVAPGPDNIFILTQSALHGRGAGLFAMMGICTGLLVHTTAIAFGVAAVFQASALAFNILKILGVLYLLYLAWQVFRASATDTTPNQNSGLKRIQLYARGVVLNVTNPKVAIFFLAFLPQFADSARGSLTLQIFTLGALFIMTTFIVFGFIALTAGFLGKWLKGSKRAQMVMNRIAGTAFVGLALKLATTER